MENKMYFRPFSNFSKCKDLSGSSSPIAQLLLSKLCLSLSGNPICFGATRNQQKNHRPKYFISFEMYFISFSILFYFFPILLVTAIPGKCNGWFLQWWFCSVPSPCIFEVIHWSHPSHRAKTELLWNFGVSISSIGEDILKFSSVTLWLQCSSTRFGVLAKAMQ